ncbi:hypothetical protein [Thalassotalea hakodatensis]|uniref:hypothetical protein n=1 Tax=Thalassotalea hakodatensis TaxID=3030492 RepID=UPI0025734426|nr:hypothetical protein [Thalassotalea hakodatensis]
MKVNHAILILSLSCISLCGWASNNPFIGTWQLVSGEYVNNKNEIITYKSIGIRSQKVIGEKHFSFVTFSQDKFWAAGTGSYQFTNTTYSEKPSMASYPLEGNGVYTFHYEMKNDQWHNSRWHDGKRVEYEIWQKVQ